MVILCGVKGTRLSEETNLKPKPMFEIGGKPILWHIMKYYSSFRYNLFFSHKRLNVNKENYNV